MAATSAQTEWIVLSALPFEKAEPILSKMAGVDSVEKSHLSPGVLSVRCTNEAISHIEASPFIKRCLPASSEFNLYYVDLTSECHGKGIELIHSLETVLDEHMLDFDGEVLKCNDDGFFMMASDRLASFTSRCSEVRQLTKFT
jgi:hypothetical protein